MFSSLAATMLKLARDFEQLSFALKKLVFQFGVLSCDLNCAANRAVHLVVQVIQLFAQFCALRLKMCFEIVACVSGNVIRPAKVSASARDLARSTKPSASTCSRVAFWRDKVWPAHGTATFDSKRMRCETPRREWRTQLFRQLDRLLEVHFRKLQISFNQGERAERAKTTLGDLRLSVRFCL